MNPKKKAVPSLEGKRYCGNIKFSLVSTHHQIWANQPNSHKQHLPWGLSLKTTLSGEQKIKSPIPRE